MRWRPAPTRRRKGGRGTWSTCPPDYSNSNINITVRQSVWSVHGSSHPHWTSFTIRYSCFGALHRADVRAIGRHMSTQVDELAPMYSASNDSSGSYPLQFAAGLSCQAIDYQEYYSQASLMGIDCRRQQWLAGTCFQPISQRLRGGYSMHQPGETCLLRRQ